ncbi:MAG: TraX family protein [Pseudomonadota bacterium]
MKSFELERLQRYDGLPNSMDVLKSLALIISVVDHVGLYFFQDDPEFAIIGRFAAPVFFFIAGFSPNLRVRPSIWWYGLILTGFVYYLEGYGFYLNILLSIGFCKLVLQYYAIEKQGYLSIIAIFGVLLVAHPWLEPSIEYGTAGIAYALCGALLFRQAHSNFMPVLLLATLMVHFSNYFFRYDVLYQQIMLITVMTILALGLPYLRYQTFRLPAVFSYSVMYMGRYTLQLYACHVLLFSMLFQFNKLGWLGSWGW